MSVDIPYDPFLRMGRDKIQPQKTSHYNWFGQKALNLDEKSIREVALPREIMMINLSLNCLIYELSYMNNLFSRRTNLSS